MKNQRKRGNYYFLNNGDCVIAWSDGKNEWQRTFDSVSKAVNFCRDNNIDAYPKTH